MSGNVTLKSYQVYHPPHELTNENVTISGSSSGIVDLQGKYDLDGQGSFKVVGPQVRGPGTLDLDTNQTVELGQVNPGLTVHLTKNDLLILDKPSQFHGTIKDFGNSFSEVATPATGKISGNEIEMPSLTNFDHGTFEHHVLSLFDAQGDLLAHLTFPDVERLTLEHGDSGVVSFAGVNIITGVRPDMPQLTLPLGSHLPIG
jgi:hypothetical protein